MNNKSILGKWNNIGSFDGIENYVIDNLNKTKIDFKELYFLPNGDGYWIFEGWNEDTIFIHYGGDDPILSYKYNLKEINNRFYLFIRFEKSTEVFLRENNNIYTKDSIGRHDNIDIEFVNDKRVIGKWISVGFVRNIEDFDYTKIQSDLYLKYIEFFSKGLLIQRYMDSEWTDKWSKGKIISIHRSTVAKYVIKRINNKDYMFVEWKMGNYIYGGMKPEYYVFERCN